MSLKETIEGLKDKAEDVLEKTDIDDKLKAKAEEVLDKTDIDDKLKAKAARRLSSLGYSSRVIYSVLEKLR